MNWLFFFTLLRINLNTKKLNLSRAYLAIPILIYNFYKFIKSQKNYIEDDTSQMESNKLMYSFFISDLILFIKNRYFEKLCFHEKHEFAKHINVRILVFQKRPWRTTLMETHCFVPSSVRPMTERCFSPF